MSLVVRARLIVARPRVAAADSTDDLLFAARSALKRAVAMGSTADAHVEQLRGLVHRLEAERRAGL